MSKAKKSKAELRLEKRCELLEELASTCCSYITALVAELCEIVPTAHNLGWRSTRFEEGKKYRNRMLQLSRRLRRVYPKTRSKPVA